VSEDRSGRQPVVAVLCRPVPDGFACEVVVGQDAAATRHQVSVSRAELGRLAPGQYDPERLVRASVEFLLAREPREAILPRFAVSAIERYFPGYEAEIVRRMTASARESVGDP
jgi:hypothetical protein